MKAGWNGGGTEWRGMEWRREGIEDGMRDDGKAGRREAGTGIRSVLLLVMGGLDMCASKADRRDVGGEER